MVKVKGQEEQDGEQRQRLFDDDEDSDSEDSEDEVITKTSKSKSSSSLQINKKFAADYVHRKQEEEYRRVKQQGGDGTGDSSESSSSSEDEDGELLTPALDVDIFKTINALRSKDDKIYDPNTKFFPKNSKQRTNEEDSDDDSDDESDDKAYRTKKSKPKRYKDVVREQTLEKMKVDGDDDSENESSDDDNENGAAASNYETNKTSRLAYDAQQKELRRGFLDSTATAADASDDDDDAENWMVRKGSGSKTADDSDDEETRQQLAQEMEKWEESATRQSKDDKLVDPKGEVPDGDKFLLDYFKKQAWSLNDREDGSDSDVDNEVIPIKPPRPTKVDGGHESDEDSIENLEQADTFEAEYNFRFEQAAAGGGDGAGQPSGADFSVVGYARGQTMNTLRRKDESRRDKRLARQERKAAERKAKEEQLKRLKNAKRQEMDAKLKQIKSVLGSVEDGGAPVDEAAIMKLMEGDFDPEKFEELMKESYGDDYYQQEDPEWKTDQDVREFVKSDEDGALLVGQDDPDGGLYDNVDEAEYEPDGDEGYDDAEEEWPEEEEYHDDDEEQPKETELEQKVKAKMMDELYKLDYEDIVAGMPTRFKYRQVEKNSYGLSTEEILFARDATLKQFVSLKKMAPYSEQGEHMTDSRRRRRFREMLQRDLDEEAAAAAQQGEAGEQQRVDSQPQAEEPVADTSGKKKKRRRLKKGNRKDEETEAPDEKAVTEVKTNETGADESTEEPKAKKRRRKKNKKVEESDDQPVAEEKAVLVEKVAEEPPKEKKKKKKKKEKKEKKTTIEGVPESRMASYGF
jgi:protein KRI1